MQSQIRALQPPAGPHQVFLLGWAGDVLTAVSTYTETDGPAQVELELMAVEISRRHDDRSVADEMVSVTLEHISQRAIAGSIRDVFVSARVYEENGASQAMCRRHHFVLTPDSAGPGVQVWSRWITGHP